MDIFGYVIFFLFVFSAAFNIWANKPVPVKTINPTLTKEEYEKFERDEIKRDIENRRREEFKKNENKKTLTIKNAIHRSPFRRGSGQQGSGDKFRLLEIEKNKENFKSHTLYLVKIKSKIDGRLYLKTGTSKYTDIDLRFKDDDTVELIEICNTVTLPKYIALQLEAYIINGYRPTPYADKEFNVYSRFSGYTEVLDMRFLKEIRAGYEQLPDWNLNLDEELKSIKVKSNLQFDQERRQKLIEESNKPLGGDDAWFK
jgi:hypothetical protein